MLSTLALSQQQKSSSWWSRISPDLSQTQLSFDHNKNLPSFSYQSLYLWQVFSHPYQKAKLFLGLKTNTDHSNPNSQPISKFENIVNQISPQIMIEMMHPIYSNYKTHLAFGCNIPYNPSIKPRFEIRCTHVKIN